MLLGTVSPILERLLSTSGILLGVCIVLLTMAILSMHGSLFSGPGPWGVPILGFYPFLKKNLYVQLHELTKKYGRVYKLNVCGQTFIYVGHSDAVKETHITKAEYFPHRNNKPGILSDALEDGLFAVQGEHWKVLRKFLNQAMRDIGLGTNKPEFQRPVEDAVKSFLDCLAGSKGGVTDILPSLRKAATQTTVRLFLGEDVSEKDDEMLTKSYFDIYIPFMDANILLIGNFARYFMRPWIPSFARFRKGVENMDAVLYKIVNRHKANFDPDQQPTNVIECYLKEKALREKRGDPTAKYFTDKSLVATLSQAYTDGSIGLGLFVAEHMYELSKRRDVQDAIHEEILSVVGTERLPTMDDRSKMPYTASVIKEAFRVLVLFPLLPGLECVRDTTVQGVKVAKGSIVLLNYWAVHNDPEVYEHPETFDPTRFLQEKTKVEPPINFGVGKRSCAGEGLVMRELFLFLTAVFQSFVLTPVSENPDQEKSETFHDSEGCLVRALPRKGGRYCPDETNESTAAKL